jgi:hypothetical protein
MPKKELPPRFRLSMDIDQGTKNTLDSIKEGPGSPTYTETIRRAVVLYDIAVKQKDKGGSLILRHADGNEERIILL